MNDPDFRASQLENDRDEQVSIKMDELVQKDLSYHMTQAEYFRYKMNWWISLNNKSGNIGPVRNRSDFNEAFVHFTPSSPRIWRTSTQASAMLEVSILAPIIDFFLQLKAMERYLVPIQMKNRTWAMYRATGQNGETCFVPSLDQTSDVRLSRLVPILLQLDRLQLASVRTKRENLQFADFLSSAQETKRHNFVKEQSRTL